MNRSLLFGVPGVSRRRLRRHDRRQEPSLDGTWKEVFCSPGVLGEALVEPWMSLGEVGTVGRSSGGAGERDEGCSGTTGG